MIRTVAAKSIGLFFNASRNVSAEWTADRLFKLFCTPFSGRYNASDLSFIKTATQQEVLTSQDQIVYHHWAGSGKKVLFVHGWESNSARWKPYINLLQKSDLDIYAIDGPAQGMSAGKSITVLRYAEAINEVVQRCQPEVIIGHSLGGMACGYYLNNYQSDVQNMVLLSTPSGLSDMMYRYFDILGLSHKMMPALEALFWDRYNISPDSFSTANHLRHCEIEGIIIHDQKDDITPYHESLQIHEAWVPSKHIPTLGLGHSLKDQRIIQGICDYIANETMPISVGIPRN